MLWQILFLVSGLVLLVGGADTMIRGATNLATALGVPPLVIGLTLVAFGTSLPEVVVNVLAASRGETELAFGNIVGSCTLNIAWVLAVTALVRPVQVEKSIITREIPMMILATAGLMVLSADIPLNHADANVVSRGDGLILLMLFGVFLYYTVRGLLVMTPAARASDPLVDDVKEQLAMKAPTQRIRTKDIVFTIAGLIAVVAGGQVTVDAAVKIAAAIGVSEVVIGMTVVSFGTTLPELVTGVLSARKGNGDIALGNVVGSNIFNILLIGGMVATISPVGVPAGGLLDLMVLGVLTAMLLPITLRQRRILRSEAIFLMAVYFGYMAWRLFGTVAGG